MQEMQKVKFRWTLTLCQGFVLITTALVLLNLSTPLCYCVFICLMLYVYIFTYVLLVCNYILIYMLFSDPEVHCCLMVIRWTSFDFDAKTHSNYLFSAYSEGV